ncbi:choline-binding transcriptional repressor BetI [Parasulfitobacter algicola]|uniref:HTH-type transcriptional regulator BetI n=1 Tax=Parasulfitobacter algicola TaxID=2614809 RepID=A0ABX2IW64_9RHOB|nr:transcriptional regulator BetI [Sulfitobacter algicola]NSX54546.1 transcriptional regulator BetI [Sulfitobacter algicola]
MPKVGMEPIRRNALLNATIAEISARGTLDVTVSQIARRAGMSSGLAHHYLGGKEDIFIAAMRHILTLYGTETRNAMQGTHCPRQRLEMIIHTSFSQMHFQPAMISAWLNFYVLAQRLPAAQRLLNIYRCRLRSNLTFALRPLTDTPEMVADTLSALIDGLYLRQALNDTSVPAQEATARIMATADRLISPNKA